VKYQTLNLVQGSDEWKAKRFEVVTASQVPSLLGLSPYQKPNQLLVEKFTRMEQEVSSFKQVLFDRGHAAEAAAREWVQTNLGLLMPPAVLVSNELPDLLASLDGFDPTQDLIFEAKYMGAKSLAEVGQGIIKPHHMYQVQAQLRVSGATKCIYFAVDESGNAKIAELKPDPKAFKMIDRAVKSFVKDLNRLKAKQQAFLDYRAKMELKYTPVRKSRKQGVA
jgi:putative phage-type endonuclease